MKGLDLSKDNYNDNTNIIQCNIYQHLMINK